MHAARLQRRAARNPFLHDVPTAGSGFLDRIEREIDSRVDERVAARGPRKPGSSPLHPGNLALCIPIVAIAGGIGGTAGLIVAFVALAFVFVLAELRR